MGDRMDLFKLTDKVAVVTGASEGIGKGIAIGLAEAGADIIVCSRREEKLKEVKADIEKTGRQAEIFVLDVCRTGDIEALKQFIQNRFGKVDILVNNAGFAATKALATALRSSSRFSSPQTASSLELAPKDWTNAVCSIACAKVLAISDFPKPPFPKRMTFAPMPLFTSNSA